MLLSAAVMPPPPEGALPVAAVDSIFGPLGGRVPSAAALGQVFASGRGLPEQGWMWGSDMIQAFLSLSRKDAQGTAWGF
jgi:hypothetical protein